jgi:acyl carrier protein
VSRAVIETIRETFPFGGGQITESTPLEEFIRDSMDAVELVAVLSSEYGIRVDPSELGGVRTVADVIGYVERRAGTPRSQHPLDAF